MSNEKSSSNIDVYDYLNLHKHTIFYCFSLLSIVFIFFKIIDFSTLANLNSIISLTYGYEFLIVLSMIFVVLFLPTYPIFFYFFERKNFSLLEKLGLTIITNLVFYVVVGYMGFLFSIPLTALYFFVATVISFSVPSYFLARNVLIPELRAFKTKSAEQFTKTKSLKQLFTKWVPINGFLLSLFLILICFLNFVRYDFFFGTDAWLHAIIIKKIVVWNILPVEDYHATLSLHVYCSVIAKFSGINILLIPRYFIVFQILVSALIFYNILRRIFKNRNLAIFGVLIFEASTLGIRYSMAQFWPSALAIILSMYIFFLLYVRLQNFVKIETPSLREMKKNMTTYYILIALTFLVCTLTHALTALVSLIGFVWIFFLYYLKDKRRGIDFLITLGCSFIFLVLTFLGIGEGHYYYLNVIKDYWFFAIGGGIVGVLIMIPLIKRLTSSIEFTTGRYKATLRGEKSESLLKFDKKIIPFIFLFSIIFLAVFFTLNIFLLNLKVFTIFSGLEIFIIGLFSVWGLVLFQKKPKGKVFMLWLIFFGILLGIMGLYEIITASRTPILARLFIIMSPLVVIGFVSYVYKLVLTKEISTHKIKIFLIFLVCLSITASSLYEFSMNDEFNISKRDKSTIEVYSEHSEDKNAFYTKFGYQFAIIYYDYPFDNEQDAPNIYDTHYIISYREDLFPPENHFDENDTNTLQEKKKELGTDVYILLDDYYLINDGVRSYGELSEKELETYYEMEYMNRVISSRSRNGDESPLYWVI